MLIVTALTVNSVLVLDVFLPYLILFITQSIFEYLQNVNEMYCYDYYSLPIIK